MKIIIKGGASLSGKIKASGAKNAMTKLLIASLLSDKKATFYNVPNIGDVQITVDLCREIGSDIKWNKEKKKLSIITKNIKTTFIPQRFSGANRIPILMLGALLGRTKSDIVVPTLGGDLLGKRSLDFHIGSLQALGATIEYRRIKEQSTYLAYAQKGLIGCLINLPYPSVGATENTILAATSAKGITIIKNAAIEPEIIDLILFLQKLGVDITVDTDRTIYIRRTTNFYDVEHTVMADRNEVASYALAAITTKGRIFIEGAEHFHMITFLNKLREVNGGFQVKENGIEFFYKDDLKSGVHIQTDVHPGFMTDWQQPFGVLLTQAKGSSVIHETVYENRFGYTQTLNEMGADMELFKQCLGSKKCRFNSLNHDHSLIIKGKTPLIAKQIKIPDLRAGFAYVMAGLIAKGTTEISQADFLDRGYEDVVGKLKILGANIKREKQLEKLLKKSKENEINKR